MNAENKIPEERKIELYLAILARENFLLGQFLELQHEKRQYIVLAKPEELDKVNQSEGTLVSDLEKTEGARFKLHSDLAADLRRDPDELDAAELYLALAGPFPEKASRLNDLTSQIQVAVDHIKAINAENSQLLSVALDYISEMQWMLSGESTAGTYTNDGDIDQPMPPGKHKIIDAKA